LGKAMAAAMDDITRDVTAIIAKKLRGKREVKLDDRLDELGLDSFATVEIIFDLEEKFDIQVPFNANETAPPFETVGEVIDAIKNLVAGKS
jgi:acyl carrier protein